MSTSQFKLPLFPLSAHVLPKGRLQLRIFEARYLRMVKESFHSDVGFGVCMVGTRISSAREGQIMPIGTQVKVVDFTTLAGGLLGITVEGIHKFKILSVEKESDGLNVGSVELIEHWSDDVLDQNDQMVMGLKKLFSEYPEIGKLYPDPQFDSLNWTVSRWLELLPLDTSIKQDLIAHANLDPAINTLKALLDNPGG